MTGPALDLAALGAVALAALLGASSGALRQLVQLGAMVAGILAARQLAAPVAAGLARFASEPVARVVAPAFLFLGITALVSLVGVALLRGTAVSRVVHGPADRGAGALLGGAKGVLGAWALLSIASHAAALAPAVERAVGASQLASLAARHDLVERLAPGSARALDRLRARGEGGEGG